MKLTFIPIDVPPALLADHQRRGGQSLKRYVADLEFCQELRIMVAREPIDDSGKCRTHVSVSVGRVGAVGAIRRPTDEEMRAIRAHFPDHLSESNDTYADSFCRHLWEE